MRITILALLFVKDTGCKSANPCTRDLLKIKKKEKSTPVKVQIDNESKKIFELQHKKTERNKPNSYKSISTRRISHKGQCENLRSDLKNKNKNATCACQSLLEIDANLMQGIIWKGGRVASRTEEKRFNSLSHPSLCLKIPLV